MAEPAAAKGDMTLAVVALTSLLAVFGLLIFVVLRMTGGEEDPERQKAQRGRGARGAAGEEDEEGSEEEEGDGQGRGGGRRNDKKDNKRNERRADADQARQMQRDKQQSLNKKQDEYNAKQRAKDDARNKIDEAEDKAKKDKEQKEQADFETWKEMFTVKALRDEESDVSEERFIEYIKVRKSVNLDDLAADFHMRTSAAIDRVKGLEHVGKISGIFDDRGKFIYLTSEEMTAVAEWLKSKGRINRADLVAACNKIVRLNPAEKDKAKLQQEAASAVDALKSSSS